MTGVQRYVWDEVNRAQSICGETVGARYEYRADGMRVKKVADLTITWNPGDENQGSGFYDENLSVNKPTTRYYYDGQMCVEEDYTVWVGPFQGQSTVVTRYGVGARGIDWMEKSGSGGGVSFPLYDGHGNMIATLSRSGSGSYAVSNARSYDVWGSVRSGASSGYPNTRYCANLGHKQDDESGLLYMRARYYEPWTGRFVTEDPARDGWNWFVYGGNCPSMKVDATGKQDLWEYLGAILIYIGMRLLVKGFGEIMNGAHDLRAAWVNMLIGAASLNGPFEVDVARSMYFALRAVVEGALAGHAIASGLQTLVSGANLILIGHFLLINGSDSFEEAGDMLRRIGADNTPEIRVP